MSGIVKRWRERVFIHPLDRNAWGDWKGILFLMHFLRNEAPIDELLAQHRAVLEYEHFVQTRSWTEVETEFPDGPPVCECMICQQLEAFSDKVVTIMRELHNLEKAPQSNEPRMETLMRDLIAFSNASAPNDLDQVRPARKLRSLGT